MEEGGRPPRGGRRLSRLRAILGISGMDMSAAVERPVARAIGFAVAAYLAFSTADALIKLASADYAVTQIGLTLALAALVPVLFLTVGRGGLRALRPRRPRLVLLRGLLTATGGLCAWTAFSRMPLADGYAILFAAPLLVTAFSALILREPVGWRRWLAAATGFAGVLVMIRPDFTMLTAGHGLAALAALFGSLSFIVLKRIGVQETSASILFVLFACMALVSLPGAVVQSRMPSPPDLGLMILAGLLMGSGQAILVLATRQAPANVVAPFQYTQMIWAVLFGLLLFGDPPHFWLLVGMSLVVGSGLYTLWRETVRRQLPHLGAARGEVPARAARAVDGG
jgi:drug/metabolite transporter (DMT)-like permease